MATRIDPDGLRLPIKLDSASNGEFVPVPLEPHHRHANRLALEQAGAHARRLGRSRRDFLVSACGAASTLLATNQAYALAGQRGGFYAIPTEAARGGAAAAGGGAGLGLKFVVHGPVVNPTGAWL